MNANETWTLIDVCCLECLGDDQPLVEVVARGVTWHEVTTRCPGEIWTSSAGGSVQETSGRQGRYVALRDECDVIS